MPALSDWHNMRIIAVMVLGYCGFACAACVERYSTACLDAMFYDPTEFVRARNAVVAMPELAQDAALIRHSMYDDIRELSTLFMQTLTKKAEHKRYYSRCCGGCSRPTPAFEQCEPVDWQVWRCAVKRLESHIQQGLVALELAVRMTLYYAIRLGSLMNFEGHLQCKRRAVVALRASEVCHVLLPESTGSALLDCEASLYFTRCLLSVLKEMRSLSSYATPCCFVGACATASLMRRIPVQLPSLQQMSASGNVSPAACVYVSLKADPFGEQPPLEMFVNVACSNRNLARIIIGYLGNNPKSRGACPNLTEMLASMPELPKITRRQLLWHKWRRVCIDISRMFATITCILLTIIAVSIYWPPA